MLCPKLWQRGFIGLLLITVPLMAEAQEKQKGSAAFLKSLVVPGWGQFDLGRRNSALAFLGVDLMLVGGVFTLRSYGASAREDYEALAAAHAGVVGDHSHDFYVDVGNWMSVDEYNERRLGERNYEGLYTSPNDYWTWDSDERRSEMESIRIKSDRAFNRVIYLAGGMVLNHIVSAIHAGRLAARLRAEDTSSLSEPAWNLQVEPAGRSDGVQLRYTYNF